MPRVLHIIPRKEKSTVNINWKVRLKNKSFWLALIPAVLLLVQVVAAVFGYTLDLGDLGNKLLAVVNAVFAVLAILGVVNDPTTAGIRDSAQALTYEYPKESSVIETQAAAEEDSTVLHLKNKSWQELTAMAESLGVNVWPDDTVETLATRIAKAVGNKQ